MSGQAQDSVVLHVPARSNDVTAAGGNFCSNGFVAELGQKPLEGFHVFRNDFYFRMAGLEGAFVISTRKEPAILPSGA